MTVSDGWSGLPGPWLALRMRQSLKPLWVVWPALAACLLGGCGSSPSVESVSGEALWRASLQAARDDGFHIVSVDPNRGMITGRRADPSQGGTARLEMRFYPSDAGYRVEPIIRSTGSPDVPRVGPAHTRLREAPARRGRRGRGDPRKFPRRLAEERELLEEIRRNLAGSVSRPSGKEKSAKEMSTR